MMMDLILIPFLLNAEYASMIYQLSYFVDTHDRFLSLEDLEVDYLFRWMIGIKIFSHSICQNRIIKKLL